MQVWELADELGLTTVAMVPVCEALGIDASWGGAEISAEDVERVRAARPAPSLPARSSGPAGPWNPGAGAATPEGFGGPSFAAPAGHPGGPDLPFVPAPRPNFAVGHQPTPQAGLRRRDPVVDNAWASWVRSAIIVAVTFGSIFMLRLFLGNVFKPFNVLFETSWLAALLFASYLQVWAAISSWDAWGRIQASQGTVGGSRSIAFLVTSAALLSAFTAQALVFGTIYIVHNL